MNYESTLKVYRKIFEEYAQGVGKEDLSWLRQKVLQLHPELKTIADKNELEYRVICYLNDFLYGIQQNKPENIRAYVEKKLREKEYDKKLGELERSIRGLAPADSKILEKLSKELKAFLDDAEQEFPGFNESRGRQISEIYGDVAALRSGGEVGSARMVSKLAPYRSEHLKPKPEKKTIKKVKR